MTQQKPLGMEDLDPSKNGSRALKFHPTKNGRSQLIAVDGNQKSGETHQLV